MRRGRFQLPGWMLLWLLLGLTGATLRADDVCIIVNGLGGQPEYEENFVTWAEKLQGLCERRGQGEVHRIDARTSRRNEILSHFQEVAQDGGQDSEVWLFLIGHANHDGQQFRFHIKGPDLTDGDLQSFLASLGDRRTVVVAATSASGALLPGLSASNRVVVTATKNRFERQPPLFMSFFLEAAETPEADQNKDGSVSLLEAFLFSQRKVVSWFEDLGQLQTEHPLLDDQGKMRLESAKAGATADLGTGAGLLSATLAISRPPERAYRSLEARELAQRRQELERRVEALKFRKNELSTAEYYEQLEKLLVELATVNEKIEKLEGNQ